MRARVLLNWTSLARAKDLARCLGLFLIRNLPARTGLPQRQSRGGDKKRMGGLGQANAPRISVTGGHRQGDVVFSMNRS